jgi:hypothetical protein
VPQPKYWRVMTKRGRKAHLTPFAANEGSGNVALCVQELPEDMRKGPAKTVASPAGDECGRCLVLCGYLKRPKPTAEDRRLKNLINAAKMLQDYGLTAPEIADVLRKINERHPSS